MTMKSDFYIISLDELTADGEEIECSLDDQYLRLRGKGNILGGSISCKALAKRTGETFHIHLAINGCVYVPCDRCLSPVSMKVNYDGDTYITVGDDPHDEDEQHFIEVADNEKTINLRDLIYSNVELNLPFRRLHKPGECDATMIAELERYRLNDKQDKNEDNDTNIDPRWAALASLIKK